MFGSSVPFAPPSSGFGQQNTVPTFGAPAPPFGGGGGGFGAPAPGTFGAPAPTSGGFGGAFGTPSPAPAFGGNTFGAPAPASSSFGSTGGTFGSGLPSSSPFGAPASAPSGGMFGSATAPSGGMFGSGSSSTQAGFNSGNGGFGGGGGFGTTQTPPPAFGTATFGSPAPSSGLFGAPSPSTFGAASNAFGTNSAGSNFGAPAPSAGMFGAPSPSVGMYSAPGGGSGGTKSTPFAVTSKQDGSTTINLQSISAMPQYEQKSFEELRFEDYGQGNRGTGASGNSGGFSGFGTSSPAPSSALFGAPVPAPSSFGAPTPVSGSFGGFGSTPAPSTGFGATSAFGAPAPFSATAPTPGGFGNPTFGAPAPSTGLFGAPTQAPATIQGGGLFGSPGPAPGGLFGSNSTPAPAFGTPAPITGSLFGSQAPAPATTGLFRAPAPAPFGAPPSAAFGAPAPGAFGGFGTPAPAPTSSLFGNPAPVAFGTPAPSGGLFGSPAQAPVGTFGAAAPSAFGTPAASGSLFGAPTPAGGIFVAPSAPGGSQLSVAPPMGSIMPPATTEILTAQLVALETKRSEMEQSDNFGTLPNESSSVNSISVSESEGLQPLTPSRAFLPSYHSTPRSASKIRPRGFALPENNLTTLCKLGGGGRPMAAPNSSAVASTSRLVIKPSPKPRIKLLLKPSSTNKDSLLKTKSSPDKTSGSSDKTSPSANSISHGNALCATEYAVAKSERSSQRSDMKDNEPPRITPKSGAPSRMVAPSLNKNGYTCNPTIKTLQGMLPEDLAAVQGFSVERPHVGKIEWEGAVDIRYLNLDTLVVIDDSPQSASVYTQEEKDGTKPPVGTKLNRPAVITLENVFPPEGTPKDKFEKRVAKSTKRNNAELISYNSSSGKWTFRVLHFSRYALADDDTDSEDESEHHFESGRGAGRSQGKLAPSHLNANAILLKARIDDCATKLELDVALFDAQKDVKAERKQGMLDGVVNETSAIGAFFEEPVVDEWDIATKYIPTTEAVSATRARPGICSAKAHQANFVMSSIDFGFTMGKSFRVGWAPDGSFTAFGTDRTLSRRKPVFSSQTAEEIHLLQQHQENSDKLAVHGRLSDCPQFRFPSFKSDQTAVRKVFKSYKDMSCDEKSPLISVAKTAFSLLGYLAENLGTFPGNGDWKGRSSLEARRIHAIICWLVDSCSEEVDAEIDKCMSQGRKLDALLAAVTGGDKDKACNFASDVGFFQLSTMLSSRHASNNDLLRQALCWTDSGASSSLSESFLRIYFLIAGDSKMEEEIYRKKYSPYDWRRRLAMTLIYDQPNQDLNLSSIVAAYEEKVKTGVAPYPQPQYLQGTSTREIHCVLYRLLRLEEFGPVASLSATIDPLGYCNSAHDYSLAFHLASAISAMEYFFPVTPVEICSLMDSYTAQLLINGKWEWAVYVSLCSMVPLDANSIHMERAKKLVFQNYTGSTSKSRYCRGFLESVGVPSKWFEEASALRCAIGGDSHGHLCHMAKVSGDNVASILEKTVVPNMLFMNMEKLEQALKLLEVFAVEGDSLALALCNLFQLYQSISELDGASRAEIECAIPSLSEACSSIEQVLVTYKLEGTARREAFVCFAPVVVPFVSFLAEAMSQISLFKIKLTALQSEIQISGSVSQILNLAQPKHQEVNRLGISDRESICKWLL
ncbi:unnamed protein product [Cylindrotheca closterium]|uniref:Peptidase S59 domain-containing protein n=1 Tax=Cylindrotheca closterium TaxID=2856 RepID=A0AAD2CRE3_9STRA|nr:unnamed protein product [Cylindrotheca closterium]